ncbi:hypothetical protein GCM10027271_38640 [Saccharopolyspora gloriosae]
MANVPNAAIVPTSGSPFGKYSLLNTIDAAVAYNAKSYHSTVVPSTAAEITRGWNAGRRLVDVLMETPLSPMCHLVAQMSRLAVEGC